MHRVLRRGGIVGGYLWDRSPGEDRSPHATFEEGLRRIGGHVLQPPVVVESTSDGAKRALELAGLVDITITTLEVTRT